jgi:hypothetical protein
MNLLFSLNLRKFLCLLFSLTHLLNCSCDAVSRHSSLRKQEDTSVIVQEEDVNSLRKVIEHRIPPHEVIVDKIDVGNHNRGAPQTFRRWTRRENGIVTIPYYIRSSTEEYGFDDDEFSLIKSSLKELSANSHVVNFRWYDSSKGDDDYGYLLFMRSTSGCSSYVGRWGGYQTIWLAKGGCASYKSSIQHETLHALGFHHEQNRPDRNKYVKIRWNNIKPSWKGQFLISKSITTLGQPYDYDSVMHYSGWASSKNGRVTIDAGVNTERLGNYGMASDGDILTLQLLYQCNTGPRTYAKKKKWPCSKNCKCAAGQAGCGSNNDACRGDLVCDNNVCKTAGTYISSSKSQYSSGEDVELTFTNPAGDRFWIGVYPEDVDPQNIKMSSHAWSWPCGSTTCSSQSMKSGTFSITVGPGKWRAFMIIDMHWPYESVAYTNVITVT